MRASGERLTALREVLGLSQRELAEQMGCTVSAVSMYETGDRAIDIFAAIHLCELYGISLDWLYRGRLGGNPRDLEDQLQKKLREIKNRVPNWREKRGRRTKHALRLAVVNRDKDQRKQRKGGASSAG